MPEDTDVRPGSGDEAARRLQQPASRVRVGDTVVYTSELNAEYRFTVTDVDDEWLTFRTGQKVHADRFDAHSFAVIRESEAGVASTDAAPPATAESMGPPGRTDRVERGGGTERTERADRAGRGGNEPSGGEPSPPRAE